MRAMTDQDMGGQFGVSSQLGAAMLMLNPVRAGHLLRDAACHTICAYNGRHDEDMVAYAGFPVRPSESFERHKLDSPSPIRFCLSI
jgi:hypothetical protein